MTESERTHEKRHSRTRRIRRIAERRGGDLSPDHDPSEFVEELKQELRGKDRKKILDAALVKYFESEQLKIFQAELIKLQAHLEKTGKKLIILFDGRDASGKGGTIRRVTRYMNEKHYTVVALGKPNEHQRTELHMKRYIECFPHAGEITLFDRSWYNRAMVEPVMGFCSQAQYRQFMSRVNEYEKSFIADGKTTLLKLYFSVTKEEQQRRFDRRKNDPLRQWKLSEVDLEAQENWDEFTEAKYRLLKKTHTRRNPWFVVRSDNKHLARLNTMKLILSRVKYRGRSRSTDFSIDPEIVIAGRREMIRMERERKKQGSFLS